MNLSENNCLRLPVGQIALRAWRLHERAAAAKAGRKTLLDLMSKGYLCFGLAKSHEEHGSDKVDYLRKEGLKYFERARVAQLVEVSDSESAE